LTRQAVEALRQGAVTDAKVLLSEALQNDPEFVSAWLWTASVCESDGERKFAFDRANEIEPGSVSAEKLAALAHVESIEPTFLAIRADPPPEDFDLQEFSSEHRQQQSVQRRRAVLVTASILGVVALLALGIFVTHRPPSSVYLAVVDGPQGAPSSGEVLLAAREAVRELNLAGGIDGHQVDLLEYNDEDDPIKAATIAREIVADGRALAVIGHQVSDACIAAYPIYRDANLPVITPTATADEVTANNPWAFRSVFNNTQQGSGMAVLEVEVAKATRSYLVSVDRAYGKSLRSGFSDEFLKGGRALSGSSVVQGSFANQGELDAAVSQVTRDVVAAKARGELGPITVMTYGDFGVPLIKSLRHAGVTEPIFGSDGVAVDGLAAKLTTGPNAVTDLNSIYLSTPLANETLTGRAVRFVQALELETGTAATWRSATTYQAVDLIRLAVQRSHADLGAGLPEARNDVRLALASADSPDTAFPGIVSPVYFSPDHSQVLPVTSLRGWSGANGSAPSFQPSYIQYVPYVPPNDEEFKQELASGRVVLIDGTPYAQQQLIRLGVNINEIRDLNSGDGTFFADAFLWTKSRGGDHADTFTFVNAVDAIDLGKPLRTSTGSLGETYNLYRFSGTFKAPLDFSDFPFDKQTLPIVIQDKVLAANEVVFAPDPDLLVTSQDERLLSGVNAGQGIDDIPNWQANTVEFYQRIVGSTAAMGDPQVAVSQAGLTFSQMITEIAISRDVGAFLIKNVLPLLLLALVTYIAVWTPTGDLASRISFGVTGILTGAVLLQEVTNSLSNVDYNVAIQWAYYAFILLSAGVVLESMLGHRLVEAGKLTEAHRLDVAVRVMYPLIVVGIGAYYWYAFMRT